MTTKIVEWDFVLRKNTTIDGDLIVHGNIFGKGYNKSYNLTVKGKISAKDISVGDISAMDILAHDISTRNIIANNVSTYNIMAWNISAGNISAGKILAMDILARDINAEDISAFNISARDISAGDISAGDIIARNISYYGVCYAYRNIKCTSINGTLKNAKHFVLNGKITFYPRWKDNRTKEKSSQ